MRKVIQTFCWVLASTVLLPCWAQEQENTYAKGLRLAKEGKYLGALKFALIGPGIA